jgi:hypothetical protein
MSKMTDAPENRLRRLTASTTAVEPANGIPAATNAAPKLRNDLAYVSVLTGETVAFQAGHLVHGQIHSSVDCRVGWTRALCDPHRCRDENPDFNTPLS